MIKEFYFKTQYAIVSYSLVGYSLQVLHINKDQKSGTKDVDYVLRIPEMAPFDPFPSIPSGVIH